MRVGDTVDSSCTVSSRSKSVPRVESRAERRKRCRSARVSPHLSHRLVGAIAVWHDIHSNLLRVPIEMMEAREVDRRISLADMIASASTSTIGDDTRDNDIEEELDEERADENEVQIIRSLCPPTNLQSVHKLSISNPELATAQISQFYPSLSEHWSSCSSTIPSPVASLREEEPSDSPVFSVSLRPIQLLTVSPDNPPRSNSVDLSTLQRELELFSISSADSSPPTPTESIRTVRSRSHDPATTAQLRRPSRIEHLTLLFRRALAKPSRKTTVIEEWPLDKHRTARYWTDDKMEASEHLWLPCSSSSDDSECYLGDRGKCERSGDKLRCSSCHVVAHSACLPHLATASVQCKTTFREPHRKGREAIDALGGHHWVHRWKYEGRCSGCSKSFQQKLFFKGNERREPVAVTCSWCKESFHVKNCFDNRKLNEKCDRGGLRDLIVPPPWIVRATRKRKNNSQNPQPKSKTFIVRRADSWLGCPSQPLLVFVNPRSGGNKGAKALQTFCWLLNPRQVFDITALKGPKFGLELYRKVLTHLRILVCGGDGTVGWVLATLDKLNWPAYPPIAIMPFGTGNDLSRCLGWGGAFSDEPLSQLLNSIVHETSVTQLDRWRLEVTANVACPIEEEDEEVHSSLPLTVMNNYFSIGADAHVALQFHHSRSANPSMLNSRLKNRIAYGGLGTIDLFKRSWRDLADFVQLQCDGVDLTPRIKELKLHCILFHNITYYAGGTVPWGTEQDDGSRASCCDGRIEVLGFTTATLATLQMGGRGERLAQCSQAMMTTTKAIPMQVDGEPCLLAPSTISLTFHSKVPMLRREKKSVCAPSLSRKTKRKKGESSTSSTSVIVHLPVLVVGRHDYDTYKDSLERLKDTAFEIGTIKAETELELPRARAIVQKLLAEHPCLPYEYSSDWRFLDYVSNADEGTFRLSRQQEQMMSLSDASNTDDCLLILDDAFPSMTVRSREIGASNIIFMPNNDCYSQSPPTSMNRRISETLRIVLSSDAQETHL